MEKRKIPSTKPKQSRGKDSEQKYKGRNEVHQNARMTPQSKTYKVTANKSRKSA